MNFVKRDKNLEKHEQNPKGLLKQTGKPQVGKAIVVGC